MTVTVEGFDEVMRNLNREIDAVPEKTMAGLMAGGLTIQASAQRKVPVEHGNLRASAYTRKDMGGALAVEVGFTAAYAVYVHENLEQRLAGQPRPSGLGVYWGGQADSGPKFLSRAVTETSSRVLDLVAAYARPK